MERYDLIVAGGGIGGSALAAVMARAGKRVLVLEPSTVFEDRVRGEWISPWGVKETRRIGLYDLLAGAGGHHLVRHITYDESREPSVSEQRVLPLGMFAEGVPGPLCIGHPHHCQTLFDEAGRAGATTLRGVSAIEIAPGANPTVRYTHDGNPSKLVRVSSSVPTGVCRRRARRAASDSTRTSRITGSQDC
jgi:2-polyprenyl-6-methoxyphenol hydroxylase-like FAD-dependent oxidoreductase